MLRVNSPSSIYGGGVLVGQNDVRNIISFNILLRWNLVSFPVSRSQPRLALHLTISHSCCQGPLLFVFPRLVEDPKRYHPLLYSTMAPGLVEPVAVQPLDAVETEAAPLWANSKNSKIKDYEPGRTVVEDHEFYEHTDLLPTFPDLVWEPLIEVPYHDKGLQGHSKFQNLLAEATDVFDHNPKIGTEIHGVNLARLSHAQKNDLARLTAIRGVVFFRDQKELDIDAQRELGQYFGKLHRHATTSVPRKPGLEEVHVIYNNEKSKDQRAKFSPTFLWHSDVSWQFHRQGYS